MINNNKAHGWAKVTLGEVVNILDRKRVPVNARDRAKRSGKIPYYGATGQVGWIDDYLFDDELVLLGEDGAPFLDGNKSVAYLIRGKSWVNNHAHVLQMLGGCPNAFLMHQLNQIQYREFVSGTTRLKLPQGPMKRIPLVIPPLPEQHRIVNAIESYLTRIDDAVTTLERVKRNLKRYRASVLKSAVEGSLVSTEAELAIREKRDFEPASTLLERILAERRLNWEKAELAKMEAKGKVTKNDDWKANYSEPEMPDSSELPDLPEGWCWTTISQLIQRGPQNGIYVPKSRYGSGIPILRIGDFQVEWSRCSTELQQIDIPESEFEKYGLMLGDIVVNRVNSMSHLGKCLAIFERHIPSVFESNMMRFQVSNDIIPGFIQQYLSSTIGKQRLIENAKWAVNQASINQGDVGNTLVPLPPRDEQIRIVREVDRLFSTIEDTSNTSRKSVLHCKRLRQSILQRAFIGKLVDQNTSDEPASILLDRIKEEVKVIAQISKTKTLRKPR